ncbi:hypothetical protein GQ44DRAFT_735987 [Phaeosphaeriaceae sp. PMI808]|nr:hypothetical protein GQ44DRAFT_735987 [Phaeosphaeriaceae sp. PMI808]
MLLAFIVFLTILLTSVAAPLLSEHFLDDVAFRAGWVTLTQIPVVYLLSTKRGPLILTRLSYERMNWMHQWIGRTIFLSATVHMAIMKSSISNSDIMQSHDPGMTVVRYGITTYAILIWIAVTSILPLRRWSHRIFYVNHNISALSFLVIVIRHIPKYAYPPIYLAVSFVALDKLLFCYSFIRNNISVRSPLRQHIRLYIPALGRFEMHPFTPANCSAIPAPPLPPRKDIERGTGRVLPYEQPRQTSEMLLMIKTKAGFTRRLANYHEEWLTRPCPNASQPSDETLKAYIDGAYGTTPSWQEHENLVLVASSTGVSLVLSILNHLEQIAFTHGPDNLKTQTIRIIWTIRHLDPSFEEIVNQIIQRCAAELSECGIKLSAEFWTTCSESEIRDELQHIDVFAHLRHSRSSSLKRRITLRIRHPDEIYDEWDREAAMEAQGIDPFETEDEYGDDSDEASTLVGGEESRIEEETWTVEVEDPFSNAHAITTTQHDDAYRPLPPLLQSEPSINTNFENTPKCQCALIQHQKRKLNTRETKTENITRWYGSRPRIQGILEDVIPPLSSEKTLVAVCANSAIVDEIREATSNMIWDFALGRRKGKVDVYIDNQS